MPAQRHGSEPIVQARPVRARRGTTHSDTALEVYRTRRDFTVTSEPAPAAARPGKDAPIFVVQKHAARRLHWDFRLEHGGVLWSWAVPKGPSLDPGDKRLAVHVEDHPLDYAGFHGTIPEGQYGAGTVEIWDSGTWAPVGDAAAGLRQGELKFVLAGKRLQGGFVLVRLKPRPKERAESWLLIKEHDAEERAGADATALEADQPPPRPRTRRGVWESHRAAAAPETPPVPSAVRGALPAKQAPQLATTVEEPPDQAGWISEVKFDGYRILVFLRDGVAQLMTRNGHDWTGRLPGLARALGRLRGRTALVDGELVALRPDGVSDFGALQAALSDGRDTGLRFYVFDLLHLDGWDLRPCRLEDWRTALRGLADWRGPVRYSDDAAEATTRMRRQACAMGLEGIVCKRADAPYRAGRTRDWVKVKCQGREEFVVIGWTPPSGSRGGLGALHLGFRDTDGRLHYVGGVGTGFDDRELAALRRRLDRLAAPAPADLLAAGDPLDRAIKWVRPELVGEVQYLAWTDAGRLRHATWLGLRADKAADEVVREIPTPEVPRREILRPGRTIIKVAPRPRAAPKARSKAVAGTADAPATSTVVTARPARGGERLEGVRLTHSDRALWPGISKRDLAEYWIAVAEHALPEIGGRPLALVRCPEGVEGEHFFQKHGKPGFPAQIRAGEADGAPFLAIDDVAGLVACAQVSAIELHAWGAAGADKLHPDRLVFDLDPGEGIGMTELVRAAVDVRERLEAAGLAAFCRTSGGKGLHVLAPLRPAADWDSTRAWCRAFAERMEADDPDRYVAQVAKAKRRGRILVDWLRNGLGATAIASFSPRARPGAGVATRLAWREVTGKLDPAAFTLRAIPARLGRLRRDPWEGFADAARPLPEGIG